MSFLWMLLIGLVVGALAKLVMPGKDPGGILITILLGIAGSLIAGFIGSSLGYYRTGYDGYGTYREAPGIIASVIGAVLVLLVYRLIVGRRAL